MAHKYIKSKEGQTKGGAVIDAGFVAVLQVFEEFWGKKQSTIHDHLWEKADEEKLPEITV